MTPMRISARGGRLPAVWVYPQACQAADSSASMAARAMRRNARAPRCTWPDALLRGRGAGGLMSVLTCGSVGPWSNFRFLSSLRAWRVSEKGARGYTDHRDLRKHETAWRANHARIRRRPGCRANRWFVPFPGAAGPSRRPAALCENPHSIWSSAPDHTSHSCLTTRHNHLSSPRIRRKR